MTKIEERAKEWADNHFDEEYKGAAFISFVKGAASKEAIDIEKACEALYGLMHDLNCDIPNIEKAKEYMRKALEE